MRAIECSFYFSAFLAFAFLLLLTLCNASCFTDLWDIIRKTDWKSSWKGLSCFFFSCVCVRVCFSLQEDISVGRVKRKKPRKAAPLCLPVFFFFYFRDGVVRVRVALTVYLCACLSYKKKKRSTTYMDDCCVFNVLFLLPFLVSLHDSPWSAHAHTHTNANARALRQLRDRAEQRECQKENRVGRTYFQTNKKERVKTNENREESIINEEGGRGARKHS